ncbi:MAG: isoprenylcysteine carboxylmethyltransferase family protein [Bacteroidales bacterium]|nr:isoprenylcysteine carboxylmethyltransferase family protein [Bacteroidales bacterium]
MALIEEMELQGNKWFRYRSYIPLIFLVVGLGVFAYSAWKHLSVLEAYPLYKNVFENVCLAVSLLGLAIRIYTVGYTPANTSGRNTKDGQVADELNTTGIYSTVRNPLYLGNFLMWLGIAMLTANIWFIISFCFLYWIYYERIIFAEEQFLRRKFGDVYLEWTKVTPAFFPKFSRYKKPVYPFSWKKVLKKEKNGLAALFIVFAIFHITERLIGFYLPQTPGDAPMQFNYITIGTVGCLVTCVLYLILKILKTYTKVLDTEGR